MFTSYSEVPPVPPPKDVSPSPDPASEPLISVMSPTCGSAVFADLKQCKCHSAS